VVFATVTGILSAIGTLGNILATTPLALMAEGYGWRESFVMLGTCHAFLMLALWVIVRDYPEGVCFPSVATPINPFKNLYLLIKSKDYWMISLSIFLRYGTFAAFQALWAGPLLIMVLKHDPLVAGNMILIMNVGIVLGFPLWGLLSDHVFHTRKWLIVLGIFLFAGSTWALTGLHRETATWATALVFFCLGFFTTSGQLMYTHIKELFPPSMAGAAMTGINFFNMLGPACFLQLLGWMMSRYYPGASFSEAAFHVAIAVCAICQLGAGILYVMTKEQVRG